MNRGELSPWPQADRAAYDTVVGVYPATPNQTACWRGVMKNITGSALNAAFRRKIEGRISDAAVMTALQTVVDRHEILRTRFRVQQDGTLAQEVFGHVSFKPAQVDLRHLPTPLREAELQKLGLAAAREPFAFTVNSSPVPLVRVMLVRMGHDLAYLHLTVHPLVMDGWSVDLFVDEFCRLADAHDAGRSLDLPPVDLHFGDYARWQADLLGGPALEQQRRYWRDKLNGLARFSIAADRPGVVRGEAAEIRSILLPHDLTDRFEALARTRNHTLASLATSTAAAAMHLITAEREIVLGTQLAGRDDPDSESIVGPLLNPVLLRLPVLEGDTFFDFADRVRDTTFEAMQHQMLPFAEVETFLADHDPADPDPSYAVSIIIQRSNISSASVSGKNFGAFRVESVPSHCAGAQRDLNLFMVGRDEGWRLSCEAATARYDTATIDALLSVWRKVIEGVIANPCAPIGDVTQLDPHERRHAAPGGPPEANALTAWINPRIEALKERIAVIQKAGDGVPIIALNSNSVLYPVARAIGTDHPFIDIQFCPSPVRIELPDRHFSDHARDAVEMIRLACPHGPYVLFGLCIFGAIALEAARILKEEGEDVPLVILNDTYRPGFRENLGLFDRSLRNWQVRWRTFHTMHRRHAAGEISFAEWLDNYRLLRGLGVTRLLARLGLIESATRRDVMQDHNRWFPEEVLRASQARFHMRPYHGRVVLFRNTAMVPGRLFPRDFGWKGYVNGGFMVSDCPGTHDTMFRPEGAAVIGKVVRRIFAEVGMGYSDRDNDKGCKT
ncbi:condensation domain-containing protein [Novosphingobium sp.]|uniref:condensation domain-containing protein n=1 Tax=Novosphingobium sp. TaxID=1874826 RepID=UPI0025E97D75|nr:condensation domain-containing protein [Novosphingobium sp.]